jgi:ankyrin repeat protein
MPYTSASAPVGETLMPGRAHTSGRAFTARRRTCLHLAASEGTQRVVETLLEHGAEVNSVDRWGGTPLRDAVRGLHGRIAQLLHSNGGTLGYTEAEASSELCEAARQGRMEVLQLMLACGTPVNAADYDARTALHLAASEGNLPIVQYLVTEAKAEVNPIDRWEGTPLCDALRSGHASVARLLSQNDGMLRWTQMQTATELCKAALGGQVESLAELARAGADVNAQDWDGRTAMHVAAAEGNKAVVKTLLKAGGNTDILDRFGNSPKDEAVRAGLQWGNDVWSTSSQGFFASLAA